MDSISSNTLCNQMRDAAGRNNPARSKDALLVEGAQEIERLQNALHSTTIDRDRLALAAHEPQPAASNDGLIAEAREWLRFLKDTNVAGHSILTQLIARLERPEFEPSAMNEDIVSDIYALLVRRGYAQWEANSIANGPGCGCIEAGEQNPDCFRHGIEATRERTIQSPSDCPHTVSQQVLACVACGVVLETPAGLTAAATKHLASVLPPTSPPPTVHSGHVDYMQRYFFEVHGLKYSRADARIVLETAMKQPDSGGTPTEGP